MFFFFFTARDTQESAHALPTYSYRVLGGRGWPGGYLADSRIGGARIALSFWVRGDTAYPPGRTNTYPLPGLCCS